MNMSYNMMNRKDTMLSEISQPPKDRHHVIPACEAPTVARHIETKRRLVVARAVKGEREMQSYCLRRSGF